MPLISAPFRLRCLFALICLSALAPALNAQSTEADLKARLMDKPLYLRGCWRNDALKFDSTGNLIGSSAPLSFTLSGFELERIYLKKDRLHLEGRRVGIAFIKDQPQRVPLDVSRNRDHSDESMVIDIAADSTGNFDPALNAIFANGLDELAPSLPSYWRPWAHQNFPEVVPSIKQTEQPTRDPQAAPSLQSRPSADEPHSEKLLRVGGGVKAPRLLHQTDVDFSEAARGLRYNGTVMITLWVGPDGHPSHMTLKRPAGLGLDEMALAAVHSYIFAPATRDGEPVTVEINVIVTFQIN